MMILHTNLWLLAIASTLVVTGAQASPATELFSPTTSEADGYNETFTFSADLAEGGFVHAQLGTTNMGPGDGRAVCRVWVNHPQAKWHSQSIASSGEWNYQKAPTSALRIGKCTIQENPRPTLTAHTDQGNLRITIHDELRVTAPQTEPWQAKGGIFETRVYAMGASATVALEPAGKQPIKSSAKVMAEHSRGTQSPNQFGNLWFRFRAIERGQAWAGLIRSGPHGATGAGWLLRGDGESKALENVQITIAGDTPKEITFHWADGKLTLRPDSDIARYEPLKEMGFFGRVMGAVIGQIELTSGEAIWEQAGQKRRVRLDTTTYR